MTSLSETNMSQSPHDMTATSPRPGGIGSRSHSISSDRPSTTAQSVMSPPLAVSPEAAFIAASAASQIVTNDHDSHADTWYDQHGFQPSGETVLVSHVALQHLNNFLDHLLFNFLAVSGSTALANLRPAVSEVLKPKLAKDAINNADEELREYLGGGDDDEFLQSPTSASPRDWDLELVWKRTRLRCMVYSSLGDMEEEDEDHHMEEGLLGDDDDESASGNVSPAVAIFLTSILEYLGEQALISAAQAAWNRMRVRYEKEIRDTSRGRSDVIDRIVVEEVDMERVALDRTLGRLWRAWKKRVRSGPASADLSHRPVSREKMYRMRLGSLSGPDSAVPRALQESTKEPEKEQEEQTSAGVHESDRAAAIALPMGDRDVDEIEVPGLVHYSDEEPEEEVEVLDLGTRPKSLMISLSNAKVAPPTPSVSQPQTPTKPVRKRANSLPTPAASPYDKRKKVDPSQGEDTTDTAQLENGQGQDDSDESAALPETIVEDATQKVDRTANADQVDQNEAVQGYSGLPSNIPDTGAAAVAAVASSAAVASVLASSRQLSGGLDDTEDDTDLEEIEEAQILTSARISIGGSTSGRSDSPASSERSTSRPSLSLHTLPVRSGSLRVVDVSSPRTPSTRSQRSSLLQEAGVGSYSRSVSRTSSINTSSNLEEPRETEETRALRVPSAASVVVKGRSNVAPSISEAEEVEEPVARPALSATLPASGPRKEAAIGPEDRIILTVEETGLQEQNKPFRNPTQPLFGSVKRQSPSSPQRSPTGDLQQPKPQRKKAATLSTPPDSGTFMEDNVGPLPRYPKHSPRQFGASSSPIGPALPEKSANRYQHSHSQSAVQPGASGIIAVDRQTSRNGIGEFARPSVDQATIRPYHTPASSSSSSKGRAPRASQDSTATRPEDVARNFEDLIKGNETIQYTLTPDNMRELEGSPRSLQSGSMQGKGRTDEARQTTRDRSASSAVKPVEVKRSVSITRATGLRSHPVDMGDEKSRPSLAMSSKSRGAAPQARDARLPRESVLEFAEFIRATGPPSAQAPPAQPSVGLRRNQSLMRDGPPVSLSSKMSTDQGRPSMGGSVSRARLQARDATVDSGNDNSDLIDFIRRGPPSSGGNPRIPRTVAPFRTTMDSDQMSSAVGGKAMDASLPDHDMRYSQASTNVTEMSAPSIQSSVNSQSALLGRKQAPIAQPSNPFEEQDMMPVRKQRRVRDPYALDFSDEEEDDDFDYQPVPSRKAQQPKEESLIDFLNNAAPPPSSPQPVPFNLPRTQSMPLKAPAPKKKASAPSLMSRFRQNTSAATPASNTNSTRGATSSARSLSSRGGSTANKGYIPIQVNIPTGGDLFPSYGSSAVPAVPSMPSQYSSRPSGRVPMKKFEPRDAVSVPSRGTSDLADFLKNSEPPAASPMGSPTWNDPVESNGSKRFGRRKKSMGFA